MSRRRRLRIPTFLLATINILFLCADFAAAQPPGGLQPTGFWTFDGSNLTTFPRGANRLGYMVSVGTSSPLIAETQRVEIGFVSTTGPTTADRNFLVRLTPLAEGHSPPQAALEVELPFRVPQNTTQKTFVRHVPKTSFGNHYEVELFENGRSVTNAAFEIGSPIPRRRTLSSVNAAELRWKLVWVKSSKDLDIQKQSLDALIESTAIQNWDTDALRASFSTATQSGRINEPSIYTEPFAPSDLPKDWRAWLPFDAVVFHLDDYLQYQQEQPPWWKPLNEWVNSGGCILIRGMLPGQIAQTKASFDAPSELEPKEIDQLAAASLESLHSDAANFSRRWQVNQQINQNLAELDTNGQTAALTIESLQRKLASAFGYSASRVPLGTKQGMAAYKQLAGVIVLLPAREELEPMEVIDWRTTQSLLNFHRFRLLRRGVEPMMGSQRFYDWVIPGVSQPPVYSFMGFLGLFVILVGPIAYRKTTCSGRSYLMFLIAPVLAIATTLAMLTYGVVADGFGTRLRARQITWVAPNGDAMSRTRSTYFAGIRPSDGMHFPANAAVTVFPDNDERSWEDRTNDRFELRGQVTVTEDDIHFNSRLLPSRQQKQFVVLQPRRQFGTVRITDDSEEKKNRASVQIRSDCELPLETILLRDRVGAFFTAENVQPGQATTASQVSQLDASKMLGEWYKREWLISSKTTRTSDSANQAQRRRMLTETFDLINSLRSTTNMTSAPNDGLFENELQQRMQLGKSLPNQSFIAIADLSDDVPAIEGISIADSIHFIMGEMP
ncbi:hypothetical protein LOC71_15280 [Rhodopirellula sp. JC740]|uniref:Uncharacterized protein n=1 Tax=Rhodopirellula halodulae TaxID=2894198 RepID=A0ABS8NJB1_9BACT|nr:hypothetical protein [Rhodopirellula sp. JC740]MCC9643647.1 hypothetical protein [Rhodopirellula sp. JC740]